MSNHCKVYDLYSLKQSLPSTVILIAIMTLLLLIDSFLYISQFMPDCWILCKQWMKAILTSAMCWQSKDASWTCCSNKRHSTKWRLQMSKSNPQCSHLSPRSSLSTLGSPQSVEALCFKVSFTSQVRKAFPSCPAHYHSQRQGSCMSYGFL